MNRVIGRSGERSEPGDRVNESCIGIGRSVDPETGLVDLEMGRTKTSFSRSPDHPITRSPDERGFTLFEVLISLTLTGFLMLALLIGMRVANRAWRTGEARLRQVHATAERSAFVVQQIASLVPYRVESDDPHLPGTLTVLEAGSTCLRFVSSYSSVYRGRTGLVLVEYGIVEASRGNMELALRETPVRDSDVLFHILVRGVTTDPETGDLVIVRQPFSLRTTDLLLMSGLDDAWFSYLDLHPVKGTGAVWREAWRSSDEAPYPDAIRLRWRRGNQTGEEVIPVRAKLIPPSTVTQ
jgi:prepilin-type N-terminal cleavage/methylation domain-containing protein